jgi:hypothetical protein
VRGKTSIAVVGIFLLTFAGSCDEKGLGDAPIGEQREAPRDVIVMPDTFPNLVVVCDGPTRIYVTTREAAPIAVHNHPACEGEEPITEVGESVTPETEDE